MPQEPTPAQPSGEPVAETSAHPLPRRPRVRAGTVFGIGSAALVAALLYANRPRKKDERR